MQIEGNTGQQLPQQEEACALQKILAVGVQFRPAGKIYIFTTTDPTLTRGDLVLVEAQVGQSIGIIISPPKEAIEGELLPDVKKVLHRATQEEIETETKFKEQALDCFIVCRDRIHERGLPMKLVDAQIEEGGRKVVFSFFSEGRVDFRSLVKDLATTLHMRIEMRQIGARDESKYHGCMGPCGLTTCCSTYLRQFQAISISMAKHQGLAPNPAKLTGMCGKLRCCLAYEHAVYNEYRQDLPKIGAAVNSPKGAGKIVGHNVLKRECIVRLYNGGESRCTCDKCTILTHAEREAAINAAREAQENLEEKIRQRRERRESRQGNMNSRDRKFGRENGKRLDEDSISEEEKIQSKSKR